VNYEELVEQTFDVNNFYCTPQGVVVYFQQYDIAPYASGIREFLLPYNRCIIDPARKCTK
ncbi:MAG TPA: RsiV family protein, partial [Syntrophomonas sp.]|nr:RsiV family protein [Syntrophomonas sp.]